MGSLPIARERLSIEYVDPASLRRDPGNPRMLRTDIDALGTLIESFRVNGIVDPLIARRDDRLLISGNQRADAAMAAGIDLVPVVFLPDRDDLQAAELSVALNTHVGESVDALLNVRLRALEEAGTGALSRLAFSDDELARRFAELDAAARRTQQEDFDPDAELEARGRSSRVSSGDVWRLGRHRLVCGDATDREVVARALDDKRAAMTWSDPPFNVDLGNHGGRPRTGKRRTMANDAMPSAEWSTFVRAFLTPILELTDGAIYLAMSSKEWPILCQTFIELGGHWSNSLIWDKGNFVLGRAPYQRQFEPILFGWREGAPHAWYGGRDKGDVWRIDRPSSSPLHPVMKPLELVERSLEHSSRPADLVLDPFGGSGTTMIACERTGRTCAMVELDPWFAEVIIRRWERFTGEDAVKIEADGSASQAVQR